MSMGYLNQARFFLGSPNFGARRLDLLKNDHFRV
jgi:hypothetical protein